MELTLDRVYQAAHVLKPVINRTDLVHATRIEADCDLYLKTENLQNTGSFSCEQVCRKAGFDIQTKEFWQNGIRTFADELKELKAYAASGRK